MSGVRVLVGTRKGAFVLTSGDRKRWKVSGPHFGGWEIYHLKGSPADPNRLYASQSSGWFGQLVQRGISGGLASWFVKQCRGPWHQGGDRLMGYALPPKQFTAWGLFCLETGK